MILANTTYDLTVTTHACANGETVECRLTAAPRDLPSAQARLATIFVNGNTHTPEAMVARLLAKAISASPVALSTINVPE